MKTVKQQIKGSAQVLLVAVIAFTTFAAAANANRLPTESSDKSLAVSRANSIQVAEAPSTQDNTENRGSDRDVVLIAQGLEWCYTFCSSSFRICDWLQQPSSINAPRLEKKGHPIAQILCCRDCAI